VRHRYDYNNAMGSTGKAFNQPDPTTGNKMEYYYHHMGRPGRRQVVDRVVKYKYPPHVGTNYQKEFAQYNSITATGSKNTAEAFNVEKEHKIINPHQVEKLTVNRIDYQPFKVQPKEPKKLKAPPPTEYIGAKSAYQSEFMNWGANEIIHEKEPQYPFYSLPFQGNSNYANTFCGGSNDGKSGKAAPFGESKTKNQNNRHNPSSKHGYSTGYGNKGGPGTFGGSYSHTNAHMANSASKLRPLLGSNDNHFETTNQRNYKDYQIKHRPQTCKPKVEVVRTGNNPNHFKTSHMLDFQKRKFRHPAVDLIPYP